MDLGKFATRENCEKGVWVEAIIFGQATGVELCILGSDSDKVRRHNAAAMREIQAMTKPQQERVNFVERARDDVVARTVGIRPKKYTTEMAFDELAFRAVSIGLITEDEAKTKTESELVMMLNETVQDYVSILDRKVEDTPSGYRFLYEQIPEMQKFAKEYSDNRANFLPKEKTSSSEQSDASSSSIIPTASDEGKIDK